MHCRRLKLHLGLLGWSLLGCGALAANPAPVPSDTALETLLRGVEDNYNHLKTVRLRFQQIYRQDRQVLRKEAGTLYLRKPGQMRWEYEAPEPKLFLSDGRRLTLYVPAENRVTETRVKQSDDLRTPLRFLLGGLKFEKEFRQMERLPEVRPLEDGNIIFKAVPKQRVDRLERVVFEVTPRRQIRRLILSEAGGMETEFRFEGEQQDLNLSPRLFKFKPPEGAEVIRE